MSEGWTYWTDKPPYTPQIQGGRVVLVPDYEVIEWKRSRDEGEPNVARVEDLAHPRNNYWNVAGVLWRPVL